MPSSIQKRRKDSTAGSRSKETPAMDKLLDSMNKLADSAAKRMTAEELREARKEINESIDRVVAGGRQRRRETA